MNLSHRQSFRFPLELLAATAARLLNGENYQDAAKRALKLLEACDGELTSDAVTHDPVARMVAVLGGNGADCLRTDKVGMPPDVDQLPEQRPETKSAEHEPSVATQETADDPGPKLPASMPFQRMLKHATGKDGATARKSYTGFLHWFMRVQKAPPPLCFTTKDFNPDGSRRTAEEVRVAEEHHWLAELAKVPEATRSEVEARMQEEAVRFFSRDEAEWTGRWFARWKKLKASEAAAEKGKQGGRGKKRVDRVFAR